MSTTAFDRNAYGPFVAKLLQEEPANPLGPGEPNASAKVLLDSMSIEQVFAARVVMDQNMDQACLAGLWLYHDYLDVSHAISQKIPTTSGSFWHGIVHRREPDSSNSKYWFQRVGSHPVFPPLYETAKCLVANEPFLAETRFLIQQDHWNPFAFIDLCAAVRLGKVAAEPLCRQIQLEEWRLLFDHCYWQALQA